MKGEERSLEPSLQSTERKREKWSREEEKKRLKERKSKRGDREIKIKVREHYREGQEGKGGVHSTQYTGPEA